MVEGVQPEPAEVSESLMYLFSDVRVTFLFCTYYHIPPYIHSSYFMLISRILPLVEAGLNDDGSCLFRVQVLKRDTCD